MNMILGEIKIIAIIHYQRSYVSFDNEVKQQA